MDFIESLDRQTGTFLILRYINQEGVSNIRTMAVLLKMSFETAYRAVNVLIGAGLIEEREEWGDDKRGGKRKNYYLTKKGKEIAKKLKEIEEIMER